MSQGVTPRIVLAAPAKVNLYLGVGALRDDGYHDVETVLQAITLADTVSIESAEALSVACDADLGLPAEENLAYRAAVALGEALGRSPDVRITLTKRIPAGGGMGGASTDAAAVLLGLSRLWEDPGTEQAGEMAPVDALLHRIAASLGADVPFFLGGGTALFGDRGDVLISRAATPSLDLALIKPVDPVPTAAAYAEFDRSRPARPPGPGEIVEACRDGSADSVALALYNNMAPAAVRLVPAIGDVLSFADGAQGVLGATVAGSGSTVFAVCTGPEAASALVEEARLQGWWAESAKSCTDGVRVLAPGEE